MTGKKYKNNIEGQIKINEDILNCKYKELDIILNSNSNKNEEYIEYLNNDIEKIEEELKNLKEIINIKHDNKYNTKKDRLTENFIINNFDKDLKNNDNINCKNTSPICVLEGKINKMISCLNDDVELIKKEIDNIIKNKENSIRLKNNINNIICKTFLFKENFNDYINYFEKYEKYNNY